MRSLIFENFWQALLDELRALEPPLPESENPQHEVLRLTDAELLGGLKPPPQPLPFGLGSVGGSGGSGGAGGAHRRAASARKGGNIFFTRIIIVCLVLI